MKRWGCAPGWGRPACVRSGANAPAPGGAGLGVARRRCARARLLPAARHLCDHGAGGAGALTRFAGWPATVRRKRMRSEEHTSELQSLMRISYAVFCLKKKNTRSHTTTLDKATSIK